MLRFVPISGRLLQIVLIMLLFRVGCRHNLQVGGENLLWDIRLIVWRTFHFFCGTAVSSICVTQTTAFSCYGFHFIYMHAWGVSCNWERHDAACVCDSVIVVFISLRKLKFLSYLLNVTHFVMRIISYANVYFAVANGRTLSKLLRCWVHGAAQGRKRKTLQVSKESSTVCS